MKKLATFLVALCATTALWAAFTPAAFTVSADGKQVYFSQGNLQCALSATDTTWSFANEQYEVISTDNVIGGTVSHDNTYGDSKNGEALANKIDLFGWSANNTTAKWGISTSEDYSDYSGDFVDWGKNIGDGNTYRTLTKDEWHYLINTRTNASEKMGVARIKLNEDGSQYANGLILLPDDWTAPEGVAFKSGFADDYGAGYYATYQTFTLVEWQKLEAAGAVFLPASGSRIELSIWNVQYYGGYWSATLDNTEKAYSLDFASGESMYSSSDRYYGRAVRLVKGISSPVTALQPAESITLYTENGRIICDGEFQIFTITGQNVTEMNGQLNGVYIVKVGDKAQKVVVK